MLKKVTAKICEISDQIVNPKFGTKISMPDADIIHFPRLFSVLEADLLLEQLRKEVRWQQEKVKIYGQVHKLPRLTAWYGDEGITYTYSGITVDPLYWIDPLLEIKARVEDISGCSFNSVLLNRYRDGSDSVSWHSDDEQELGPCPPIGSVSFGETRSFQMKHKVCNKKQKIILRHGSYLLMKGNTQRNWLHQIPKSKHLLGERINLTFRHIIGQTSRCL
tara:strand:+ start:1305 stop:1964 length:660 start_codon:yes stop_codon:yes gene_type:complete